MVNFIQEDYQEFASILISSRLKLSYKQLHNLKLISIQRIYKIFTSTILY